MAMGLIWCRELPMKPVMRVQSSGVKSMEGTLMRLTVPLCLKRMAAVLGMRGCRLLRSKVGA